MARISSTDFGKKINTTIGKNIRNLRIARGIAKKDLSKALDITHQQLYKYESGNNGVSAVQLHRIAKILDININYFYEEPEVAEVNHQNLCLQISKKLLSIKNSDLLDGIKRLIKSY
jgi:transcriptional regulator with XRE-family HTH domain